METIKFKYDRLFSELQKEMRKFEKILNNPKTSLSDDEIVVHNKLGILLDELKFQWGSEFISTLNEKGKQ